MQWALQDFLVDWDPAELSKNHDLLEKSLIEMMQNKGEVLFLEAPRNLNTTYFYLKTMASDMALAIFDLEGIELSTGSACASGAAKKSAVMKKVGLERLARNGLRLSHSPFLKKEDVQEIIERFKNVMDKI
jgi:cysteine desulfurase